jgi:hypothetical protein
MLPEFIGSQDADDFDFRTSERKGDYETIKKNATYIYSLEDFQDAMNDEDLSLENSFILIQ